MKWYSCDKMEIETNNVNLHINISSYFKGYLRPPDSASRKPIVLLKSTS